MSDFPSNTSETRPVDRNTSSWAFGAVLILIGVVLLFQNITGWNLTNWWALFILIPAFGALRDAYEAYRFDGRLSRNARGKLVGAAILGAIAFFFLFNLSFGIFWPLLIIAAGVSLLLNAMLPD